MLISESVHFLIPFTQGFALSVATTLTIGPQVIFILRQAIMGGHLVVPLIIFLSGELVLVSSGILGGAWLLNKIPVVFITVLAAALLMIYAIIIGMSGIKAIIKKRTLLRAPLPQTKNSINTDTTHNNTIPLQSTLGFVEVNHMEKRQSWKRAAVISLIVTYGNPQVYFDTVFFIGSVANTFSPPLNYIFGVGSIIASIAMFVFLLIISPALQKMGKKDNVKGYIEIVMSAMLVFFALLLLWRIL